ncbi:MAG: protein translocase subunit SecF [Alphaproteobacteria bacterium]|jgi:preprotein translocase subunit SecF|nr:protein translocase subunit SecF [Alphaproteobacteria bacterium]
MLGKILNKKYNINFIKHNNFFIYISVILLCCSIFAVFFKGFNKGIDFAGGILIEIRSEQDVNLQELRLGIASYNLGDVSLQDLGSKKDIMIRVGLDNQNEKEQIKKITLIKDYLQNNINENIEFRRVDFVGPTIGKELIKSSIYALFASLIAILLYIWLRFSYRFGFGALLALLHDIILVLGVFILFNLEFNLTSIAAILTIIGYSINDSVVIYDRIRENSRKYRSIPQQEIINKSINETLNRTILTAITTLVALLALVILGGPVLKSFSISVLFGVLIGTYSSIFIATITIKQKAKKIL